MKLSLNCHVDVSMSYMFLSQPYCYSHYIDGLFDWGLHSFPPFWLYQDDPEVNVPVFPLITNVECLTNYK